VRGLEKMSFPITKQENIVDRLEMIAVEPPEGVSPFMQLFCLNYLTTGKVGAAMLQTENDMGLEKSEVRNAMMSGSRILRRESVKKYIHKLKLYMQEQGVAKSLDIQLFLTEIVDTPIGMIDANSRLCEKRKITRKYDGKGGLIEEVETFEMPSKLGAAKTLNQMNGYNAAVKVDLSVKGGIMLVPHTTNLEDWEKQAQSQTKLMEEAIDI